MSDKINRELARENARWGTRESALREARAAERSGDTASAHRRYGDALRRDPGDADLRDIVASLCPLEYTKLTVAKNSHLWVVDTDGTEKCIDLGSRGPNDVQVVFGDDTLHIIDDEIELTITSEVVRSMPLGSVEGHCIHLPGRSLLPLKRVGNFWMIGGVEEHFAGSHNTPCVMTPEGIYTHPGSTVNPYTLKRRGQEVAIGNSSSYLVCEDGNVVLHAAQGNSDRGRSLDSVIRRTRFFRENRVTEVDHLISINDHFSFVAEIPLDIALMLESYSRSQQQVQAITPQEAPRASGPLQYTLGSRYSVSDEVKHGSFGVGTVLRADARSIDIDFGGEIGVKKLAHNRK